MRDVIALLISMAVLGSCQNPQTAVASPLDERREPADRRKEADFLYRCNRAEDCALIPVVPDGGHSGCMVVVNRSKVTEFYATVWKANEADFRRTDGLAYCRASPKVLCVDGLCYAN